MVKINYKKELFKGYNGLCESVFCAPFEEPIKFKEEKYENGRFDNLVNDGHQYLKFTNIKDCDYVIIPYKWDNYSNNSIKIISEAKFYNKKIITLYNDDNPPYLYLNNDEGYIFTTTINSNQRKLNEFPFPAFTGDFFNVNNEINLNKSIGFCGAITHNIRYEILSILNNSNKIKTNFIIRKSFWADAEMTKDEARIDYLLNLINNAFTICIRGAGNFSYRLYETLMMGRIPLIINTNQVFPFENIINYDTFSFRINYGENIEKSIYDIIENISDNTIISMQKKSREIWLEYMSPLGWIKNFEKELCLATGV